LIVICKKTDDFFFYDIFCKIYIKIYKKTSGPDAVYHTKNTPKLNVIFQDGHAKAWTINNIAGNWNSN